MLQNRLSWETYNNIRTSQGLKRRSDGDESEEKVRKHGCLATHLEINKQRLLDEARTWEEDQSQSTGLN